MVTESHSAYPLLQILWPHLIMPVNDPPVQVSCQDNLIMPHLRHVPHAPHIHPWTPLTLGRLQSLPCTHTYKPEAQES